MPAIGRGGGGVDVFSTDQRLCIFLIRQQKPSVHTTYCVKNRPIYGSLELKSYKVDVYYFAHIKIQKISLILRKLFRCFKFLTIFLR